MYDAGAGGLWLGTDYLDAEASGLRSRQFDCRPRSASPSAGRGRAGASANYSRPIWFHQLRLAFSGNHLFVGNYNGINTYDIDNPAKAKLRMSLMCPGGQGDVSVYGHLLFMSAEAVNGRTDCGTQGIPLPAGYVLPPVPPPAPAKPGVEAERPQRPPPPASPDRFRGVRIFDISDVGNPKQVAAVQSCRGSHTHTLVLDPKDKDNVYIYISGTGAVRQAEELAGVLGRGTHGQSRDRAVQDRYHQGAAGAPGAGEDRIQPPHLY